MTDDDHIDRYDDGRSDSFSHEVEVTFTLNLRDYEVTVAVHLKCIEFSTPPTGQFGPPEFYDPGSAAEFELEYAEVSLGSDTVKLTPDLFWALLGDKAHLIYDAAYEAAQDSGEY